MIRIKNVTKDYGSNKGVFDLSFEVQDQETFGLLGMEGAGKTTLLQILMGFSNLSGGRCTINAKHCWKQSTGIKNFTGYLPQKITLPESMTGLQFFRFLADLRNRKSLEKAIRTADAFELDTSKKIRDLNQEEKKKLAIAGVFLHDPEVLLLDEPESDLGEKAKVQFMNLILEEKSRGKTILIVVVCLIALIGLLILIATGSFATAERLCDRIGILRRGMLVNLDDVSVIREASRKVFCIGFRSELEAVRFVRESGFDVLNKNATQLTVSLSGELQNFIKVLSGYKVLTMESIPQTLEETFTYLYGGDLSD